MLYDVHPVLLYPIFLSSYLINSFLELLRPLQRGRKGPVRVCYPCFDGDRRCPGLEPTEPRARVNRPLFVVVEISCFNKNGVDIRSQWHQIRGGT